MTKYFAACAFCLSMQIGANVQETTTLNEQATIAEETTMCKSDICQDCCPENKAVTLVEETTDTTISQK